MTGGFAVFGDQREAAGFAVETIDDTHLATVGDFVGKESAEFVPESGGFAGLAGMCLKKRRLVHDKEIVALGDDSRRVRWLKARLAHGVLSAGMGNRHPVHDKLRALPLFVSFTDEELARLLDLADPTAHERGEVLVAKGDDGDAMYLLAEGEARVVLRSSNGTESELGRLGAGDFFGELALVDQRPRSADVIAACDGVTLKITSGIMQLFAAESASAGFKLAMAILGMVAARVRVANERYRVTLGIVAALSSNQTVMKPLELQHAE
jgi:CRP-like cAMP-binding protein